METYGSEQYIEFPDNELQEVQDNSDVVQEESCKSEIIVAEILPDSASSVKISDIQITTDQTIKSTEERKGFIHVKQETQPMTSGDDESMAVEALRQLGGMYPCFDNKVNCPTCSDSILSTELDAHRNSCKPGKYVCSTCSERFEKKADYNNHMICHQVDRPHACRICGHLFRTKANLQTHMTEAHQVAKLYKCNICGVDFQRPSSLSNHMKIHTYVAGRAIAQMQNEQKAESQASTSVVATIQDYDSVQWSMPVYTFTSEQAGTTLESSNEKLNTLQEFTVIPNDEVTQFEYATQNVANSMNQQFVAISTFENADNGNNFIKKIVVGVEENKKAMSPIECEYCDKQFQDANHLATHQKTCVKRIAQAGGKEQGQNWGKHACSECGKKFTTKQKMFRHQWIHRKKTHSCEVCGTQFERQVQLDEHRLAAHPGDSPFTCAECGKSFVSRQGLWEHGRTHAGSPAHFHCDKCSKTFTSRQGYLIHHRTHTGERPYGCKFCWKAFRDGGTLRKHERIHTGERPHVCPLCARAFNQKVVLREHVRWVHAAAKHDTEASGPPFPCPLCGDMSQDRDELCAHIVKHSDKLIAQAKAKTSSEPKKTAKTSKRKGKKASTEKVSRELEESVSDQQQIYLTVAEPFDKTGTNQNVYVDSKQNTYILVDAGKNSKLHIVSDLKQNSTEIGRIKGNAIQICIENQDDDDEVMVGEDEEEEEDGGEEDEREEEEEEDGTLKRNTLRLISKQNAETPVLAIPNPQTSESYSSHLQLVAEDEGQEEYTEQEEMEIMQVDGVVEGVEYVHEENEVGGMMNECGVCGEVGFKDKRELMEHVKIHI